MNIADLGEFPFIDRLAKIVSRPSKISQDLLVGIGDDAAAWKPSQGTQLCTTDTLVEGVHFVRGKISWHDLGWKAMAVNISDIGAMGGQPQYAVVTLGLPIDTAVEYMDEMYTGILEACEVWDIHIVGGDIVRSPVLFITVALIGLCSNEPLLRSTANPGDLIAVTGILGASAGARASYSSPFHISKAFQSLQHALDRPQPRVEQGQLLAKEGVRTAIDISDGLLDDLSKLCKASGVSAKIYSDSIPYHPSLRAIFPQDYLDYALGGGEDYELIFTASAELMSRVIPILSPVATVIGTILTGPPGRVELLDHEGQLQNLPKGGWDHLQ